MFLLSSILCATMPVSFSYSIIPGGIKRSKRSSFCTLASSASSTAYAPLQLRMNLPDRDRRNRPSEHFHDEHGCRCCPAHHSRHDYRSEEEAMLQSNYHDQPIPRPIHVYKAFSTGEAYFPSRCHPQHAGRCSDSSADRHARTCHVIPLSHVPHKAHAPYLDEIGGRRIAHVPASPMLRPKSSGMASAGGLGVDSPIPQIKSIHVPEEDVPMDFKATAEKLFSVLLKAEKFFDVFLQSFKQETAAAYMDRASEWKRKVHRYNSDLVLPTFKLDGEPANQCLHCFV